MRCTVVVMVVTLLLPAAVRPQHCSADCRAGARCCSEAQCADQPADAAQPQYQGVLAWLPLIWISNVCWLQSAAAWCLTSPSAWRPAPASQ